MQRVPWFRIWIFVGLALCIGSFALDNWTIAWVAAHRAAAVHRASSFASKWGDFLPLVGYLALFWIAARLAHSEAWQRLLGLMLASGVAAGIVANILRATTCRARPDALVPPGWYGLQVAFRPAGFHYQYASFPSAHTSVAFGMAFPLLFARRGWAAPGLLVAVAIAASRIFLNAHHLSDVMAGVMVGSVMSWVVCYKLALGQLAGGRAKSMTVPEQPAFQNEKSG